MQIWVISGRSGSGKTSALNLLEDEGFTCIDNLPISLLPMLIKQVRSREKRAEVQLAIGIDARNLDSDLAALPALFESVKEAKDQLTTLYLKTAKEQLLRRFSETRRRHPLTNNDTDLNQAITEEDLILAPLANLADVTLDTTHLSLHELRSAVKEQIIGRDHAAGTTLVITSFGFKYGLPANVDFVFDVRCLPNPYWDNRLRTKNGLDADVAHFLSQDAKVQKMLTDIEGFIRDWLPEFEDNNRSYLNIAIGCTGGMHRSVFISDHLGKQLQSDDKEILIRHRQLDKKK